MRGNPAIQKAVMAGETRHAEMIRVKVARNGGITEHVCIGCGQHSTTHPSEICDGCFYKSPGGKYDGNK